MTISGFLNNVKSNKTLINYINWYNLGLVVFKDGVAQSFMVDVIKLLVNIKKLKKNEY